MGSRKEHSLIARKQTTMTNDELHAAWHSGESILSIARRCNTSEGTMAGRLRRLREREGVERWPHRAFGKPAKGGHLTPRAGKVTLPPLESLKDA